MPDKNGIPTVDEIYNALMPKADDPRIQKKPAKVIKKGHELWLKTPGSKGQKHNETDMRRISNSHRLKNEYAPDGWMDKYLENWELLG